MTDTDRSYDVVVLGASGLTGRLAVRHLATLSADGDGAGGPRWAAAGRDEKRLASALRDEGAPDAPTMRVDVHDAQSLRAMAESTRVVLSFVGPYTSNAEKVIDACVRGGASYVDISGELALLARVNRRFDAPARKAGVAVVQMAGWEALPADVTTMLASRAATDTSGDGMGAGGVVSQVSVTTTFTKTPGGKKSFLDAVSAGTIASIAEILRDPDAGVVGDPGGLIDDPTDANLTRRGSPLKLRPRVVGGRLIGLVTPVAFLNPPVVHRTAARLAKEAGATYRPATYLEGTDMGLVSGLADTTRVLSSVAQVLEQRAAVLASRVPHRVRQAVVARIQPHLPASGRGPTGAGLTDWKWIIRAEARTHSGALGQAELTGTGHPGYTATAAMAVQLALHLATGREPGDRSGALTPSLALGGHASTALNGLGLSLQVSSI